MEYHGISHIRTFEKNLMNPRHMRSKSRRQDLRDPRFKVQYALWHHGTSNDQLSSRMKVQQKKPSKKSQNFLALQSSPCNHQFIVFPLGTGDLVPTPCRAGHWPSPSVPSSAGVLEVSPRNHRWLPSGNLLHN